MTIEIVQIVQELSSVGGAESVASELACAFSRAKIANTVLASAVGDKGNARYADRARRRLAFAYQDARASCAILVALLSVPTFTLLATRAAYHHPKAVIISHGDSLTGDVLVVHAVNAQSLAEKRNAGFWSWMLNPHASVGSPA